MSHYDIGDLIKLYTATPFTDKATDNPVDPNTIRFKVRSPDSTVTTYVYGTDPEVVRNGTGDYHLLLRPDAAGTWRWRLEGRDSNDKGLAAEEGTFDVAPQIVL